jgi:Cytochrome bd terminal oxidase subunit I
VLEGQWLRIGKLVYRELFFFWSKIFAVGFGMGVVSGVPVPARSYVACGLHCGSDHRGGLRLAEPAVGHGLSLHALDEGRVLRLQYYL